MLDEVQDALELGLGDAPLVRVATAFAPAAFVEPGDERRHVVEQVAVVVDRVDDRLGDALVRVRERGEADLLVQVILDRAHARVVELGEVARLAVASRARARRRRGLVDVLPRAVDRQLLGQVVGGIERPGVDRRVEVAPLGRAALLGGGAVVAVRLARLRRRAVVAGRVALARLAAVLLLQLEHRVALERLLDLALQLERRELQQLDRLLELRRHGQRLAHLHLQGLFHARVLGWRAERNVTAVPKRATSEPDRLVLAR